MLGAIEKPARGAQHDALEVFLGDWKAEAQSFAGPNQAARSPRGNPTRWSSTHNARWHTGKFFLIQDERAQIDGPFDTLSIMGWDDNATVISHAHSRTTAITATTTLPSKARCRP